MLPAQRHLFCNSKSYSLEGLKQGKLLARKDLKSGYKWQELET